ncbi:FAD-dependent oxidoreductase [Rhizobium sp. RU36D]|uniref:NAD(P)/FAD-dependent oxidoreductase n=1 Tax=Rhizobium sp. RU36D TaxID=1907415 RepID=UPI0009FD166C|nr:FAD-dependent oxidoreductase [Rhizobium sp. RU36D]
MTTFSTKRRVAVVGSGISGLSAAWLLSQSMEVVLYEAEGRLGGHSNTVDVNGRDGKVPVDTGFIVYNNRNYPNLVALFDHLSVPTEASDMSFSASLDGGAFEYSGSGLSGLLGQRSNVINPRFWRMLSGIMRFYREAPQYVERGDLDAMTLGDYLDAGGYSDAFVNDHLLPMGAAIWSTTASEMRAYPLVAFMRFFVNHGLVVLKDRPQWRTVSGGSREYIKRILADFRGEVRTGASVAKVTRSPGQVTVTDDSGHSDLFTDIIIATHADQALAILGDADTDERNLLGAFDYTPNTAVLHSDTALMPRRRSTWASWNYIGNAGKTDQAQLCVTYWMNMLQNLKTPDPVFVTLNPSREIADEKVIATFDYAHPLFDSKALKAQKQLWRLQGQRNTWYCGAHFGSGFHEDGLQSGLAAAESLGGVRRPWDVADESGRIVLGPKLMAAE